MAFPLVNPDEADVATPPLVHKMYIKTASLFRLAVFLLSPMRFLEIRFADVIC